MDKLKKWMKKEGKGGIEAMMKKKGMKPGDQAVVMVDDDKGEPDDDDTPALKKYQKGKC